jgi:hypothetical protein
MTGSPRASRAEAAVPARLASVDQLLARGRRAEALAALDAALIDLGRTGASADRLPLHLRAADLASSNGGVRFHLTYAYVFALELGDRIEIERIETRLRTLGGL